jgi:NADH:ubiquinone oxidoreductase subunit 6 (subunit J)
VSSSKIWDGAIALVGAVAVVLAIWAALTATSNQALRKELASKQPEIARITTLNTLYSSMVQLLNRAVAETNDSGIAAMMQANGITPGAPPQPLLPAPATPAAPTTK